jgi:hypothetical protein
LERSEAPGSLPAKIDRRNLSDSLTFFNFQNLSRLPPHLPYVPEIREGTMVDGRSGRGSADRAPINVHDADQVIYWARNFSCSLIRLGAAIQAVGTSPMAVERWLASHRMNAGWKFAASVAARRAGKLATRDA